jgi:hypothetical protein
MIDKAITKAGDETIPEREEVKVKIPSFNVILGAGASVTGNIWAGKELKRKLFNIAREKGQGNILKDYLIKNFNLSALDWSNVEKTIEKEGDITFEMVCSAFTEELGLRKELEDFFKYYFSIEDKPMPLCYEILAHLIATQLVDNVITFNFDELFERALDDEIGRDKYSLVVTPDDFKKMYNRENFDKPMVIKLHGDVNYNKSLKFTVNDVTRFSPAKKRLLERILSNSYIIIAGFSCESQDMKEFFDEFLPSHRLGIYWIKKVRKKE